MKISFKLLTVFVAVAVAIPTPSPDRFVTGEEGTDVENYKRSRVGVYSKYEGLGKSE